MPRRRDDVLTAHFSHDVCIPSAAATVYPAIARVSTVSEERAPISPEGRNGRHIVNLQHPITRSSQYFTHFFAFEQFMGELFALYLPGCPISAVKQPGTGRCCDNKRYRLRETFSDCERNKRFSFPRKNRKINRSIISVIKLLFFRLQLLSCIKHTSKYIHKPTRKGTLEIH